MAGPVGVHTARRAGCRCRQGRAAGRRPLPAQPGYHVWNRSRRSVVIDLKADEGREAFLRLCRRTPTSWWRPSARAPWSGWGSPTPELVGAVPPLGVLLGAGLSARTPLRRSTRLGRHRAGPLGHAERAARLAARAHLPPLSRPEHGRLLPLGGRRPLGPHPARGERARAARADVAVSGRPGLHHADLAGARTGTRRLSLGDGEDLSARHPSGVALRVRRR